MSVHRRSLLAHISAAALTAGWAGRDAFAANVTYTYDNIGRLKTVTYPDGTTITYSYDAAGNRTSVVQNLIQVHATLAASPATIVPGASAQLSWTTTNASAASIPRPAYARHSAWFMRANAGSGAAKSPRVGPRPGLGSGASSAAHR